MSFVSATPNLRVCSSSSLQRKEGKDWCLLIIIISSKERRGGFSVCSSSSLQRKEGEDLGLLIIICSKERRGGFVFAHHHLFKGKKGRICVGHLCFFLPSNVIDHLLKLKLSAH